MVTPPGNSIWASSLVTLGTTMTFSPGSKEKGREKHLLRTRWYTGLAADTYNFNSYLSEDA